MCDCVPVGQGHMASLGKSHSQQGDLLLWTETCIFQLDWHWGDICAFFSKGVSLQFSILGPQSARSRYISNRKWVFDVPCSFGNLLSSSHPPERTFLLWLLHSGPGPPTAAYSGFQPYHLKLLRVPTAHSALDTNMQGHSSCLPWRLAQ